MISKRDLLKMLWGVVNDDSSALAVRADAARNKSKYWKPDDWIHVKDTEVSLKHLKVAMIENCIALPKDISQLVLDGKDQEQFIENDWALEKIEDCRKNMRIISNPE